MLSEVVLHYPEQAKSKHITLMLPFRFCLNLSEFLKIVTNI